MCVFEPWLAHAEATLRSGAKGVVIWFYCSVYTRVLRVADRPLSAHLQPTQYIHPICRCQVCDAFTRMPMVTPCAHTLCLDCAFQSRQHCPLGGCGEAYVMQPVDDLARRTFNTKPKWEVRSRGFV